MSLAARRIGPDPATSVAAALCDHCGGPLGAAPVADDGLRFCCRGCSGARRLIHGLGLDRYYSLRDALGGRSEEHTSELQSLMRISYAVFCLKKKNHIHHINTHIYTLNMT